MSKISVGVVIFQQVLRQKCNILRAPENQTLTIVERLKKLIFRIDGGGDKS
jgi:hypothetical protein